MSRTFTLEYWQEDAWYIGRLKEVPGVFSQGETIQALEANIRDAHRSMVEDAEEMHIPGVNRKEITVEA